MKGDFAALQNAKLLQKNQEGIKGIGIGLVSISNQWETTRKAERKEAFHE
jgi:hypothetical protein